MISPTSPCLALNVQVASGWLWPRPGISSAFPNHCESFELTLSLAYEANSSGVFGFDCLRRALMRVISSRAVSLAVCSVNCMDSWARTSSNGR